MVPETGVSAEHQHDTMDECQLGDERRLDTEVEWQLCTKDELSTPPTDEEDAAEGGVACFA